MSNLTITVLGSGTSQGVPVIACDCYVCMSEDPKDNRTRSSIMVSHKEHNYVIDTGPDFRTQMLRHKVKVVHAILFTHEHKDHVAGLDDIRAFNFKYDREMEIYCTSQVEIALNREFHYIFQENKYPGVPSVDLNLFETEPILLASGLLAIPIKAMHYKLPVTAFRFQNFAYLTDVKTIENSEKEKLYDLDILIVNCLQIETHISHFNLKEALDFIDEIKPKLTYLTHISHNFGTHFEIEAMLPPYVKVAYDGLTFETN